MEANTQSLCPVCLKRISARRVLRVHQVYLEKTCPEHGFFSTLIWQGSPDFMNWKRPKVPSDRPSTDHEAGPGCPYSCGLCPQHRQRTCTLILEVTDRCNLQCPVCYADAGHQTSADPSLETLKTWLQQAKQSAGHCNLQLSGGEPTLRDDLPEVVHLARQAGFDFIQINTNGLRAATDGAFVQELQQAGLTSAFLQFDGLSDAVYIKLRGRSLLKEKLAAIEAFCKQGIGVVLVPTLVPGINTHEVGDILKAAVTWSPVVRAVHFQPVSYFGRYAALDCNGARLTLPEVMQAIEAQTGGMFKVAHFKPPGCENARCSFHGQYVIMPDGRVIALQSGDSCCTDPVSAETGACKAIASVARQWALPLSAGTSLASACDGSAAPAPSEGLMRLEDFLATARTRTFSVSAMAFQDAWNLDLDRVQDCCIHVLAPSGRRVPFCLYNLTAANGRKLYR